MAIIKVLFLLLSISLVMALALPNQMAWLRIKSDKSVSTFFEWTEFCARRGNTMGTILKEKFGSSLFSPNGNERELYLYKMIPIDLNKTFEELGLNPSGEDLYLTEEDIMAR